MTAINHHCPKCRNGAYETGELRVAGGFWSILISVTNRRFGPLSLLRDPQELSVQSIKPSTCEDGGFRRSLALVAATLNSSVLRTARWATNSICLHQLRRPVKLGRCRLSATSAGVTSLQSLMSEQQL